MAADHGSLWLACGSAVLALAALGSLQSFWKRRYARRSARIHRLIKRWRQLQRRALHERVQLRADWNAYLEQLRAFNVPGLLVTSVGEIVAANRALLQMFGYETEAQLRQSNVAQLFANPERQAHTLPRIDGLGAMRNLEVRCKRRDGTLFDVRLSWRVVRSSDGTRYYEGTITDITELKSAVGRKRELEEQLHMAQKLEAVGRLAAGIAHEINTPIQFVGDNAHFLHKAFGTVVAKLKEQRAAALAPENSELERLIEDARSAFADSFDGIERVTEIVRAMKDFAHPSDGTMTDVDINRAVATTLIVSRNEYKNIARIETSYGDVPPVKGHRGELNKVLLNMIVNAAHALEARARSGSLGLITVTTHCVGPLVSISIADNGCGIAPAAMKRIFDPFFTTKPIGKGTGQGLAIAHSVIRNHGGRIEVQSTPSVGTTFTILLPASRATEMSDLVAETCGLDVSVLREQGAR
jgi:PAS domain S-box-containing protein